MSVRRRLPARRAAGFALAEALVAAGVSLVVLRLVFEALVATQALLRAQPEAADRHQRMRVLAEALAADLRRAGAGPVAAPLAGGLAALAPPVVAATGRAPALPRRPDAIDVLFVPPGGAEARLAAPAPRGATVVALDAVGCPQRGRGLCGFSRDARVVLGLPGGAGQVASVAAVNRATGTMVLSAPLAADVGAGAAVIAVVEHAYWLDAGSDPPVVRRARDGGPGFPLVDGVTALRFDLAAEAVTVTARVSGGRLDDTADEMRFSVTRRNAGGGW